MKLVKAAAVAAAAAFALAACGDDDPSRPALEPAAPAETFTTDKDLLQRVPRTPPPGAARRKRSV